MGRGGSENAAALWISVEVRGLEKGWGPEWSPRSSLLQSGPVPPPHPTPPPPLPQPALHSQGKGPREAPPRCSEAGWGMAWLNARKGQRVGSAWQVGRHRARRPRCTCAGTPCSSILSALVPITQPPPRSSSMQLHCSPLPPPPLSSVPRPSPPHQGPPPAAAAAGSSSAPKVPAGPHRLEGGGEGGRWDNPPALRSRAPSRMGVAWLRPSPQRLTSRLCHPPRPSVQLSRSQAFGPQGSRRQGPLVPASVQPPPPWPEPRPRLAQQEQDHDKVRQFIKRLAAPPRPTPPGPRSPVPGPRVTFSSCRSCAPAPGRWPGAGAQSAAR